MAEKAIQQNPFPDILASKEVKATDAYGLLEAEAIWGEYLLNVHTYNSNRERAIINRQYAEGFEDSNKYKRLKSMETTAYANLDFTPVNAIASRVDNIVGYLMNIPFKIECNAIDSEAQTRFDEYLNKVRTERFLANNPQVAEIERRTKIPIVDRSKKYPQSSEEEDLFIKMNYKDEISIAMEEAFNFILSNNMFEYDREKMLRDLVENKKCALHTYYDEDWNIKFKYRDFINVITPYSKEDDYSNIPYIAYIDNHTIGDLAVMNPLFTDKDLWEIAKQNEGANNGNAVWNWGNTYEGYYKNNYGTRPYNNFNIQTLYFYFLSIDEETREYKEHRNRKYLNKKETGYVPEEGRNSKVYTKKVQNLYEGKWIINSKHIFDYQKSFNIPREKTKGGYSTKAELPLFMIQPNMRDMQNKSHVERAIPHEDQINLNNLAWQTEMIKWKPSGSKIDIAGLIQAANLLANGTDALDLIKMYEQGGNLLTSSQDSDGNPLNSTGLTELNGGNRDKLEGLILGFDHQKKLIDDVMGWSDVMSGTNPNPDMPVGTQDNAIAGASNSLKPLYNAHLKILEKAAKRTSLMIQDCVDGDNTAFTDALGAASVKVIKLGKRLSLAQIGVKINLLPDKNEMVVIQQQIQAGQNSNPPLLTPSDVIRINQLLKEDVKLAGKMLVFLEEKNRTDRMKEAQALSEQNGQVQIQSAKAASEQKQQEMSIEWGYKKQELEFEAKIKSDERKELHLNKMDEIQATSIGLENVENIKVGKEVQVAYITKDGKIAQSLIASHTTVAKEGIIHNKEHTLLDREHKNTMEENDKTHENDLETLAKTPNPTSKAA